MEKESLVWHHLIAAERVKEILSAAYIGNSLGHAYLFCGEAGVGKFAAALDLSLALLCTAQSGKPCLVCPSCHKALRNSHPDFHPVLPISLDKEHRGSDGSLSASGWDFVNACAAERIRSPYLPLQYSGVPHMPVELIKETNQAIARGAVDGKRIVAVICDVDLMSKESANAMLKTLEEPPANTYLILTTSRPEAVLPTIASRCQIVRFGHVPAGEIRDALLQTMGIGVDETLVKRAVHFSMGSLGRALLLATTDLSDTANAARNLWDACASRDTAAVFASIDSIAKQNDYQENERLFAYLLYCIRNSFLQRSGCPQNYIDAGDILRDTNDIFLETGSSDALRQACNEALSGIRAYGNIALVLTHFAITVMEILHVKQQQAG